MLLSAPMNHPPHVVSSIPMLTTTVMKTPSMSIITCIDVDACAGSTLMAFSPSGSTDPRQTLRNTMDVRDVVTATDSAKGVAKHIARTKPAAESMAARAKAILNSLLMKFAWVSLFREPTARPRITLTLAWLPAFPPAPTSMVRKYMMTGCICRSCSFRASMNPEHDCMANSPTSHTARSRSAARKGTFGSSGQPSPMVPSGITSHSSAKGNAASSARTTSDDSQAPL
mmetsp:Transcript_44469/g.87248  ORF Transcript_44469/g.87248 Transcript_44469/m.87248 type:complete len:228 (-) Transcript_44469:704-1387(-)